MYLLTKKTAVHRDVEKEMERLGTSAKLNLSVSQGYDITGYLLKLCYLNAYA